MVLLLALAGRGQAQTYTALSGNALNFNGATAVRMESGTGIAALQPSDAITLEAWVNVPCCQATEHTILAYGDGVNDSYILSVGTYGPRLQLQDAAGVFTDVKRTVKYEQLNTGRDYHIAVTWSKAAQKAVLYIDGFKYYEQSGIPAFDIFYNAGSRLTIGSNTDLSQSFNGRIDEVRIWNTERTQAGIRAAKHNTLTGSEPGLVAYYRFDEATAALAAPTGSGPALTGYNMTTANKVSSTAHIPAKVSYYTSRIQNTVWDIEKTIATGVTWKYKLYDTLFDNRQSINILDIDLAAADVDLRIANLPTNTNSALAKMKTSDMLKKYGAIAAVNGSYYNTASPYGAATFLREAGTTAAATNQAHGVGYPDEKAIVFNTGNADMQVIDRPAANQSSPAFQSGWNGFAGFDNVLSGGPGLLTGGNVTYEYVPMDVSHEGAGGSSTWRWHMSYYPFTAAGVTAGNHLILATGDGRTAAVGGVAGLTVEQVAYLMKALGCTDALKLDGGGSSTMAIEGATYSDVVNYPSDNGVFDHEGERANPNALLLIPRTRRGSGSALAFDGTDDRVVIPHGDIGNPTGNFSVEGWARVDNGSGDDALISKHDNTSGRKGYYIQYSYSNNKLSAGIGRSNNSWGAVTATTPSWQANQWHHFAMTYNPATDSLRLYVDGELAGATVVPDPVFSTNNLCIGGSDFYPANAFKGGMDEVRFWSRELSQEDIRANMHRNVPETAAGLTAYYKFDDFTLSPVKDYSAAGTHGTTAGNMNLYNIVASYAPIAGARFDSLVELGANWSAYNTSVRSGTTVSAAFTAENKYLLLAHNNATGDTVAGVPAGLNKRLRRSWLADKFGNVTESMNLAFNTAQLGAGVLDANREYFLLFSENGADYQALSATGALLVNNSLVFAGVTIREGWYTIGWKPITYMQVPGNKAIEFNGAADIVRVPYASFGNPAGDFSIELWARIGANGSGDDALINANENVSGRKGYFIEYGYANSATPGLKTGIARSNGNWLTAQYATANWQPNEWHHVAMTYNATTRTITLFQDGVSVATANMGSNAALFSTRPFGIGGSDAYTGNGFKGAIDEVRVWNKALTATEIKDSMHLQVSPANPMLKAYYKLDSLAGGTTLINETGTALNATAATGMSVNNLVASYAPVDMQPLIGFLSYNGNWAAKAGSYNKGLKITTAYTGEAAYLLHKTNNRDGLDTTAAVAYKQLKRVWYMSKKGIGNSQLQLEFYRDSLLQVTDTTSMVYLLHSGDNTAYQVLDSLPVNNTTAIFSFSMQDTLNGYLGLGLKAGPGMPLPVDLVAFTAIASPDQQAALLEWQVAGEHQLKTYIVERSTDAIRFTALGSVAATGKNKYDFRDETPVQGVNYYRLKMEDADGSYVYSKTRALLFRETGAWLDVRPNPVNNQLQIIAVGLPAQGLSGSIVDLSGRLVQQFLLSGTATILDTRNWGSGTYLVKLSNGKVFKVVKL